MLQVITSRNEIQSCEKQLHARLVKALKQKNTYSIGYQGGNFDDVVHYNDHLWFSTSLINEGDNKRYWNGFGTKLIKTGSNSIVVEANIPFSGINRSVSGLFAKDPLTGDVFLLHRGRLGGGKKGVGKSTFSNWYSGEWAEIDEGGGFVNLAILITALSASSFFEDLSFFVHAVEEFKDFVSAGSDAEENGGKAESFKALSYRPEFSGIKRGKRPSSFIAECNHGRIVNALRMYLQKRDNLDAASLFNNCAIDLGVKVREKIIAIYEVKTGEDTQSIYTGIGQLMFRSAINNCGSMTLVLPHAAANNKRLQSVLKKLGILLLGYVMIGSDIRFVS